MAASSPAPGGGMKNTFDARRRNIGIQPPDEMKKWRDRLIVSGIIILSVAILVVAGAIWWSMTHVTTVHASVKAAVRSLAADVDARVAEVLVRPGEQVKEGQPLVRLDDSSLRAQLNAARAELAIKESLHAQAQAAHVLTKVKVETDVALARTQLEIARGRVQAAASELASMREKVPVEIRRAKAQRDEAQARLNYLKKGAREERVEGAKARLATAQARAALADFQVKQIQALVERRIESQLELEVARTDYAARQNEVLEAKLNLDQLLAGPTTEEIEAAAQALEARVAALDLAEAAEREIPVQEAHLAIRKAELQEAEAQLAYAQAQSVQIEVAAQKVTAAAAELEQAKAQAAAVEAALGRMTIFSPVAGTIIRTFDHPGEICKKGVTTVLVADDSAGRWIEGFITEDDSSLVRGGQRAQVEIVLGSGHMIEATVKEVGLSTSAIGRDTQDGPGASKDFAKLVWVRFQPKDSIQHILPGMSARATIRVRGGT